MVDAGTYCERWSYARGSPAGFPHLGKSRLFAPIFAQPSDFRVSIALPMKILAVLLLLISGIALLGGLASLSNATSGVGGIAVACFLAILARIAQASGHHDELRKLLSDARAASPAAAAETTPASEKE